jgi:hypothetical protein
VDNKSIPTIEDGYRAYTGHVAESSRLSEAEDFHREAMHEAERKQEEVQNRIWEAHSALVRSILAASPGEIPDLRAWDKVIVPPWQVRSGDRIFTLVPARDSDIPTTREELVYAVTLAVIDLDSGKIAN